MKYSVSLNGSNGAYPEKPNSPETKGNLKSKPIDFYAASTVPNKCSYGDTPINFSECIINCKKGKKAGKDVAKALVGYTTAKEQAQVEATITKNVNGANVLDFLKYYDMYASERTLANSFFKQMATEYGFDSKQDLMRHVAKQLLQTPFAFKNCNVLANILEQEDITKYADDLDRIANEYCKYYTE